MTTVYVYVMDTMADWEIGCCLAELHSKRFFRKDAKEISFYIDKPAVRDGNLITAAATGALEMTRLILEYLDVFGAATLEHWYAYFSTGNANEFFAMMQSLQK